jgi:hypothetical protein
MTNLFKPLFAAGVLAASLATPVSAQNYYRSLDGSDGCLIDIGRSNPSNSYYDYAYVVSNRCSGRYFKIHFTVNGTPGSFTVAYGSDFKYDLKNSDVFQLTAIEE